MLLCCLAVYNALGIEIAVRNKTQGSKASYDSNAVMRLLTVRRIINPAPKRAPGRTKEHYFFRTAFSLEDTYRAMTCCAAARDKIVSAINRAINKMGIRDTACVFYDVTNYYFEIDDLTKMRV